MTLAYYWFFGAKNYESAFRSLMILKMDTRFGRGFLEPTWIGFRNWNITVLSAMGYKFVVENLKILKVDRKFGPGFPKKKLEYIQNWYMLLVFRGLKNLKMGPKSETRSRSRFFEASYAKVGIL